MKIITTLLLSLCAGTLAFNSVRPIPANIIDTSFLSKVGGKKKTSFTQLTTMMGELRDISQITDFLQAHLQSIEDSRQQKLAIIQSDRAKFADESQFRQQEIQDGEEAAAASQKALTQCTDQKAVAEDRNQKAAAALVKFQAKLQALQDARDAQHKLNLKHVDLLEDFQSKLVTLNSLLDDYEAAGSSPTDDGSFIQITNKLLKNALRTGQSTLIGTLYNKLIQMHTKQDIDEDDLSEVRQLLSQMDDLADQQILDINNQDAEQQSVFEQNQSAIQDIINVLTAQVSQTANFIDTANQCIDQESSILQLSNDKVTRNQDLLDVAVALDAAVEQQWSVSEQSRRREVNVVNALLSAVKRLEEVFEAVVGPQVGDLVNLKML